MEREWFGSSHIIAAITIHTSFVPTTSRKKFPCNFRHESCDKPNLQHPKNTTLLLTYLDNAAETTLIIATAFFLPRTTLSIKMLQPKRPWHENEIRKYDGLTRDCHRVADIKCRQRVNGGMLWRRQVGSANWSCFVSTFPQWECPIPFFKNNFVVYVKDLDQIKLYL